MTPWSPEPARAGAPMKSFLRLKSVDEVLAMIFALPPLGSETVDLAEAGGRRIYETFFAPADLPGFARSSMDGYAARAVDVFGASESSPALLSVGPECPVGVIPAFTLKPGQAAPIVTGAPLPAGADAVIRVEDSRDAGGDNVEIIRSVAPGDNIVEADEDAKKGAPVILAGRLLRAPEIGVLAAFGAQKIKVFGRPRIAVLSTGDEIVPLGENPPPGKLRDVNSHSLEAFCKLRGALPVRLGVVRDDPGALAAKLAEALPVADAVVVSGGSSAGARDFTVEAFLGTPDSKLLAHGVAMRPGKPFILATSGGKCLLGLPGHVTSALISARVLLAPLLARLQGLEALPPQPWINATLDRFVPSAQGRRDYIRCRLEKSGDEYIARPLRDSSAVLSGLIEADGLIVCPENSEGLVKGRQVKFYPF